MSKINEIREREKAATEGPWIEGNGNFGEILDDEAEGVICRAVWTQDMPFIAHSRADIPYLLAKLDEAVGMLKKHGRDVNGNCVECGSHLWLGEIHSPNCALNALIKEVEG